MPVLLSMLIGVICLVFSPGEAFVPESSGHPYLLVLGIAQDGGHPHSGCERGCCAPVRAGEEEGHLVSCLALVDPASRQSWIFDATPDFPEQLHRLEQESQTQLAGIFLTHAHIGHYTGLMHLGREVMGASRMPVYAMPGMKAFLENNGPWSQLVTLENIALRPMEEDLSVRLTDHLQVTPFLVPHRDEFSETVGFRIDGPAASALFIPDIDKWERWERDIVEEVKSVDYAFIDGSFYQDGEIKGRSMSEIPHPFIRESMQLFSGQPEAERKKVFFIHLNHTNPAMIRGSEAYGQVIEQGFNVASPTTRTGM